MENEKIIKYQYEETLKEAKKLIDAAIKGITAKHKCCHCIHMDLNSYSEPCKNCDEYDKFVWKHNEKYKNIFNVR